LARGERKGEGWGGARWGETPGRCGGSTGLRGVCGHRRGTLRRELFDCTYELQTKPSGDEIARFATQMSRFTPQTSRRNVNSRCCERFFAKNFIGRITRRNSCRSGLACGRLRCAGQQRRQVCALLGERTGSARRISCIWSRANRAAVGGEVSLDQPSRQQGIAAFVHPHLKKLLDFLSQVRSEIQSRALVRLQSRFRRVQKKIPIHFLPCVLAHGDTLLMDAVRYPFINTGQGKRALKRLWIFVQKSGGYCAQGTAGTGVSERCDSRRTRGDEP
jgi:hypothetical protein